MGETPALPPVSEILVNYRKGMTRDYDIFLNRLMDPELRDDEMILALRSLKGCVAELGKEFEFLIGVILKLDWLSRRPGTIQEYQSLILNLVSANTFYLRASLRMMVRHFTPKVVKSADGEPIENDSTVRGVHDQKFIQIHTLLRAMLKIVPMAPTILMPLLAQGFPYVTKEAYLQECYVKNLLQLSHYLPGHRSKLLELVIDRMTKLDVQSPREAIQELEDESDEEEQDVFDMEGISVQLTESQSSSNTDSAMPHAEADKLDVLMDLLLGDIKNTCHDNGELDWESTKKLYRELLSVFDRIILPTHACCHVQFLMFYICSFREPLVDGFLDYLWKKFLNPNTQAVFRQASVGYIASFLARSKYVTVRTVKAMLDLLVPWAHTYITQSSDTSKADVAHHGPFYSLCQTIFYVFVFRHKELLQMSKGLKYCQSLNLQTLVTCRLNPLRVCFPIVANTFSSIARQHQLAFCDTILEKNKRALLPVATADAQQVSHLTLVNPLDLFFPFDPYLLKRSGPYIHPLYRDYEGTPVEGGNSTEDEDREEDDYEMEVGSVPESQGEPSSSYGRTPTSPAVTDFLMYGVSPGFKHT